MSDEPEVTTVTVQVQVNWVELIDQAIEIARGKVLKPRDADEEDAFFNQMRWFPLQVLARKQ